MKKTVTLLFAFLLFVIYSCEEKIDYNKERIAIIAAVEEETAAYYASDFDRWSATYLQDSTLTGLFASKSGTDYYFGWEAIVSGLKQYIVGKKELQKEVKKPIRIKIYEENAWIVFDNESFNSKGESTGKSTVTNFLEKQDGKWKIVYRNVIQDDSYYQPDYMALNSISYVKSLGKNVADLAGFAGDQFKTGWTGGFNGLVNGMLYNWGNMVPKKDLKIIEQDSNHIVFTVKNLLTGLKTAPVFNVTYDDYLTVTNIACQKISDYMGATYLQETTPDGVRIAISKR